MITKLTLSWPSLALCRPVEVIIGLPAFFSFARCPYKCIWALHCSMESASFFFDRLNCGSLVEQKKIAVIAPSLGNGYFINSDFEAQGDFLEELACQLPQLLPLSINKEENNVIGISMGGFGAIRWALSCDRFERAIAISGVFNCYLPEDRRIYSDRALKAIYLTFKKIMANRLLNRDGTEREQANIGILVKKGSRGTNFALYCGAQDYISLNQTLWLQELMEGLGIPVRVQLLPGSHNSEFWKRAFHTAVENILNDGSVNAAH